MVIYGITAERIARPGSTPDFRVTKEFYLDRNEAYRKMGTYISTDGDQFIFRVVAKSLIVSNFDLIKLACQDAEEEKEMINSGH